MSVLFKTMLLAAAVMAGACVSDNDSDSDTPLVLETGGGGPGGGSSGYVGSQGRLILGFKNSAVNRFRLEGQSNVHVDTAGQLISDQHKDLDMQGVAVWANDTIQMKITSVTAPNVSQKRWQYHLQQWNGAAWEDACDDPTPIMMPLVADPAPVDAIAMTGSWDGTGHYTTGTSITFSCHAGVAAKCTGWGYPFDGAWAGVTESGNTLSPPVTGADMLQVCSRVARADYCGVGLSNTLPGTPIHFDDIFNIIPAEPGYVLEGAWRGSADRPNGPQSVVCLSKRRWSTLPLGGLCPALVTDPRLNPATGAFFCEHYTNLSDLEALGARMYSASPWIDAGLWNYRNPANGYRLATTYLQPTGLITAAWVGILDPGIGFSGAAASGTLESTIFNLTFPYPTNVPGAVSLYSYKCGTAARAVTTTANAPAGCTTIATEGLVYPDHTAGRAQLRRWIDPAGGSYTTTTSPATMIASHYTLAELSGSVIRSYHPMTLRWSTVAGATYQVEMTTSLDPTWITCANSTASSFPFSGLCGNVAVDRNDITGFRVTARVGLAAYTNAVVYDGIATDVHVDLASFLPTALTISWTDVVRGYKYAVTINGNECFSTAIVGNDLSRVVTNRCPSLNTSLSISTITTIKVCGSRGGSGLDPICGTATYDGVSSSIAIKLK